MYLIILPALALALPGVANAGSVRMYTCSNTKSAGKAGSVSAMAIRVHYNNHGDGCDDLFAFDAETGVIPPLLGWKTFCGDDGFCANIDLFPSPGLHISLDGKEVALGEAVTNNESTGKGARIICNRMGIDNPKLSVSTWDNAPKTKCK